MSNNTAAYERLWQHVNKSDDPEECNQCGRVETVDVLYGLCHLCKVNADAAYDNHVDPLHVYH